MGTASPRSASSPAPIRAVVFDAYGTLFDVHSVASLAEQLFPGKGDALSQLWRQKQLEYSWLRAMSGRYKPFWDVTRDALRFAAARLALRLAPELEVRLMNQYASLSAFPENLDALRALRAAGLPLGILSNGNREMIEVSVRSAGMTGLFEHLLSSQDVETFKTSAPIYALAPAAFGCRAREILFVSSNCWDAIGARWYGYASFWVNRSGAPLEQLDTEPDHTGSLLTDVLAVALR
ncbi:MAG: haloacid dehalogenase type II [Burkholderiaceae bacterium]|nr:haloacid dehalogenase type II [Burkholderiaceae bacterium]